MNIIGLLNEYVLPSTFKFGFELEGYYNSYNTDFEKFQQFALDTFAGEFGNDSSIKSGERNTETFEYKSGIIPFTPASLQKFAGFLLSLPSHGIKTNETCSIHVHFSFPNITSKDAFWTLCQLAMNDSVKEEFLHFKEFNFFEKEFATVHSLKHIKNAIINKDHDTLLMMYNNEKFNVFRIHPQGTIEWRGPRDFLNEGKPEDIKGFILKLYSVVKFISRSVDTTSISYQGKTVLTKADFDKAEKEKMNDQRAVHPYFEKKTLENLKTDLRFIPNFDKKILEKINKLFPWLFKGKFANANITLSDDNQLLWWGGTWLSGTFESGYWKGGVFKGGTFKGKWSHGVWKGGNWEGLSHEDSAEHWGNKKPEQIKDTERNKYNKDGTRNYHMR